MTSRLTLHRPLSISQRHDKRQSPLVNNSSPNATPQPKANGCSPLNDVSSPLFSLVSTVTSNALQANSHNHNSTSSSPLLEFNQQAANLHSNQSLVNSILQPNAGQAPRPSPNSLANSSPFLSQLASNLNAVGGQQQAPALQQQLNTSNNSSLNNSMSNSHLNSSNNSNSSCNSSLNNQSQSGSALANSNVAASLLAANPALAAAFGKNMQQQNGLPWNLPNALSSVYNQALANAISSNNAANAQANALNNLNTLNSLNSLTAGNSSTFGKLSASNQPASSSANRNSPNTNSAALTSNNVNNSLAVAALVQQLGINPLNAGALSGMSLPNIANLSQVAQLGLNLSSLTNNLANSDLKSSSNQSAFPFNLYSNTGLDLALAMAGAQASSSSAGQFNGNAASSKKLAQSSKHSLLNGNQSGSLFSNAFSSQLLQQQQQQHLKQLVDLGDGDRAKEDDLSAINCEGELFLLFICFAF